MTRLLPLVALCFALAACSGLLPDAAESGRRGAVEVAVKAGFPAILEEIEAGGGPNLLAALDAAGVPEAERPARLIQLRGDLGLYEGSPGALTAALLLFGR